MDCPICLGAYASGDEARQPWLLGACGYTMCKTCCNELQRRAGTEPFACPHCRAPVRHTTRNFALVEALANFQQQIAAIPRGGVACEVKSHGDQSPPATVFCVNCDKRLCSACSTGIHQYLEDHEVIAGSIDRVERNCARHRTPMLFFCQKEECRTAGGCLMCFELDKQSPHYGHPHAELALVEGSQRAKLERLLAELNARVSAAQDAARVAETRFAELFGDAAACGGGTTVVPADALVQRAKADIDRNIDERIAQVLLVVAQLNCEREARKREVDEIAAQTAKQLEQFTIRVGEFMSVAHAAQTAAQQVQAQGVRGALFLQRAAPVVAMLGDVLRIVLDLRVPAPSRVDVAFPPLTLPALPSPFGSVARGVSDPPSGAFPPATVRGGVVDDMSSFVRTFGSRGAIDGNFKNPIGVCVDYENRIVVADFGNHRIQVLRRDGTFVRKFGSPGDENGQFNHPTGCVVSSAGRLIVADRDNHRMQVFSSDGAFLFAFGSLGAADGEFDAPRGVCVDGSDNIYVADCSNHRIQVFNGEGTFLRKFGTHGSGAGQLNTPVQVCVCSGFVLVADLNNHRIQEFRPDGTFVRAFGSHGDGVAQFNGPVGVCVDGANNIFVTDRDNHRVQQFRRDGTFVRAFGSSQGAAFGQFNLPQGVCVTADGALLVADYLNNRIQEFR